MGLNTFFTNILGKGGPMKNKGKILIPKGNNKILKMKIITDEIEEKKGYLFENLTKEHQKSTIEKGWSNIININNQQRELLQYAKELCLTSDYAFKDFIGGKINTDNFMERNNKAKEDFEKLFKEIYEDKILKTKEGDELQFEQLKFESNSNSYTVIFSSKKEEDFDGSGKQYWFVSGGTDMPIYQSDIRNYDKYVEGMNTQFNFEDESRKKLEEILSYNNNADLFNQYRSNSLKK